MSRTRSEETATSQPPGRDGKFREPYRISPSRRRHSRGRTSPRDEGSSKPDDDGRIAGRGRPTTYPCVRRLAYIRMYIFTYICMCIYIYICVYVRPRRGETTTSRPRRGKTATSRLPRRDLPKADDDGRITGRQRLATNDRPTTRSGVRLAYICMYIYTCTCMYIYIYVYVRPRHGETETSRPRRENTATSRPRSEKTTTSRLRRGKTATSHRQARRSRDLCHSETETSPQRRGKTATSRSRHDGKSREPYDSQTLSWPRLSQLKGRDGPGQFTRSPYTTRTSPKRRTFK